MTGGKNGSDSIQLVAGVCSGKGGVEMGKDTIASAFANIENFVGSWVTEKHHRNTL